MKRHGVAAALHFSWMKLVNLAVPFRILRCMCVRYVHNGFVACPNGYEARFLGAKALLDLTQDTGAELPRQFVNDALGAGNECLAIFRGEELAAYGWYSTRPTPALAPELVLHFAPGYVYQYKGFTVPAHRGQRLHAIGKTRALRHYLSKGYRGLLSYVESTNFESLKSNDRMGYETFGSIYVVRLFGRYLAFSTPGCRRYQFRLEPAAGR
jgi:hypothetical protein